jgi:hypothetical protein
MTDDGMAYRMPNANDGTPTRMSILKSLISLHPTLVRVEAALPTQVTAR